MNAKKFKSYLTLQKLVAKKFREAKQSKHIVWAPMGSATQIFSGFDKSLIPTYPQLRNVLQGKGHITSALELALHNGYNTDLCSDLRCEIGNQFITDDPRGELPKPDFILGMNFTCSASVGLYNSWVNEYPDVDSFLLDAPNIVGDEVPQNAVDYLHKQFLELIDTVSRSWGIKFDVEEFRNAAVNMAKSQNLINRILQLTANTPSPIELTSFQPYLIPLAYYSHYEETYDYLLELESELKHIISSSNENKESIRLCWDFLPIYKHMPDINKLLNEHNAKIVIGTSLTSAFVWPDPDFFKHAPDPLAAHAYAYVQHHFRRDYKYKARIMADWIRDYHVDGIIFHSARNCRAHSLPSFLVKEDLEKKLNIPTVVIEADVMDSRAYSKSQILNRLEAFLETF